jgi:hypothetical protein
MTSGAVQDLSPYSFAANSGGTASTARFALPLPSFAITGYVDQETNFSTALNVLYKIARDGETVLPPSLQVNFETLLCGHENLEII